MSRRLIEAITAKSLDEVINCVKDMKSAEDLLLVDPQTGRPPLHLAFIHWHEQIAPYLLQQFKELTSLKRALNTKYSKETLWRIACQSHKPADPIRHLVETCERAADTFENVSTSSSSSSDSKKAERFTPAQIYSLSESLNEQDEEQGNTPLHDLFNFQGLSSDQYEKRDLESVVAIEQLITSLSIKFNITLKNKKSLSVKDILTQHYPGQLELYNFCHNPEDLLAKAFYKREEELQPTIASRQPAISGDFPQQEQKKEERSLIAIQNGQLNSLKNERTDRTLRFFKRSDFINFANRADSKADQVLLAAKHGHLAVLKFLVQTIGFSIEVVNEEGQDPLFLAFYANNLEMIQWLITEHRFNIKDSFEAQKEDPILLCATHDYLDILKYLVDEQGFSLETENNPHAPLEVALKHKSIHCIQFIFYRTLLNLSPQISAHEELINITISQLPTREAATSFLNTITEKLKQHSGDSVEEIQSLFSNAVSTCLKEKFPANPHQNSQNLFATGLHGNTSSSSSSSSSSSNSSSTAYSIVNSRAKAF